MESGDQGRNVAAASVSAGSSPRAIARSTMALIAPSRTRQNRCITSAISGEVSAAAHNALVVAAPSALDSVACTDPTRARRSDSTDPVSGTSIRASAAWASASTTRSGLVRQRR